MITDLKRSGVTVIPYRLFNDIEREAAKYHLPLKQTKVSYSFRIYDESGLTKYIHIHYK